MCTAISHHGFFGRNLDLEYGYDEEIVITPRMFPLIFRKTSTIHAHHAYIGMAAMDHGYPLYFDAVNEQGLAIAALDFPDNAYYPDANDTLINIAPFEVIPWIMSQCGTVQEVIALLQNTRIVNIRYSDTYPQAPLHWMVADKSESIVIEIMKDGTHIHENPVGVLCNNPPFPYHLHHLAQFQHLSTNEWRAHWGGVHVPSFGGGLSATGLPGDYSSPSRFVKAAFVKLHSHCNSDTVSNISQFFHILDAVAMPRGAIRIRGGKDEITRYSSCCDLEQGIYYFTTYENRRIHAVQLHRANLNGNTIESFPLFDQQDIFYKN